MPNKPPVNRLEQQTAPNGAREHLRYTPLVNTQAFDTIGNAAVQLGNAYAKAQDTQDKLKIQNFEEQLNNEYKAMNNALAKSQSPEEYDEIAKTSMQKMQEQGRDYLGKRLFGEWEANQGQNYYAALKTDVEGQKISLMQKLNYKTAQETVEKKAYDYAYASPAEQKDIDDRFTVYLATNDFTPMQQQELKTQYEKQKVNGQLSFMLDQDPSQIAKVGKDGKVWSVMDDPNKYKTLSVHEKMEWKQRALRKQKEAEGTTKEKKLNDFLTKFNQLWQDTPSQAEIMYQQLLERPADFEQATGLTATQVKSAYSYMKDVLEQGEAGMQKQGNWADVQTKYNSFGLDDKGNFRKSITTGGTKIEYDRPTVEQLTDLIGIINDGITVNGFGSGNRNAAIKLKRNLMHELATQIKNSDVQLSNTSHWYSSDTVSEYMQKRIKEKLEHDLHGAEIPDELIAQLYVDTFNTLRERGVDLAATDTVNKTQARAELGVVYAQLIGNRYLLNEKETGAVLTTDGGLLSFGNGKTPTAPTLKEPQGYKPETINDVAYMVRRDKDGNIIDKYPAWMKL